MPPTVHFCARPLHSQVCSNVLVSLSSTPSASHTPSASPTRTPSPTPSPLCVLEDFDEAYVGVSQDGLPLPNGWTAQPTGDVGVFSIYPSLSGVPGAVPITPFHGSKFAYLISGDPDAYTTLTATIDVANAGLIFVSYLFFDTFETAGGLDDAYEAVVSLTPPSNVTTVLYAISAATVATGDDYSDQHGGQTGWVRVSYTFTEAGPHEIVFAVRNQVDSFYNSALAVVRVRRRCCKRAYAAWRYLLLGVGSIAADASPTRPHPAPPASTAR